MARDVMAQLIDHGEVRRGMLGVTIQSVTPEMADSAKLSDVRGAIVSSVAPGSPADKAGVKQGDVIVAIDGAPVADSNVLRNQVARRQPGTEMKLTVMRNGREEVLMAELGRLAADGATNAEGAPASGGLGLSVRPLTPESADWLGIGADEGLLVTKVEPGSQAEEAGFRAKDVIEQVNGKPVDSASSFQDAMKQSGGRPALVLTHRQGQTLYLTLRADA